VQFSQGDVLAVWGETQLVDGLGSDNPTFFSNKARGVGDGGLGGAGGAGGARRGRERRGRVLHSLVCDAGELRGVKHCDLSCLINKFARQPPIAENPSGEVGASGNSFSGEPSPVVLIDRSGGPLSFIIGLLFVERDHRSFHGAGSLEEFFNLASGPGSGSSTHDSSLC